MHILENEMLQVIVDARGAELKSVLHKGNGLEYMWGADPAYWAKTSPVLFPIVGALKNNTYQHGGKTYSLPRHGFARDRAFEPEGGEEGVLSFFIRSDAETKKVYPFAFRFAIRYALEGDELTVTYVVENPGGEDLFFSVGGHPAFKLPLAAGTAYSDYRLVFEQKETAGRWPISGEGLIGKAPLPLMQNTQVLPLTKELFAKDAIVLKDLRSRSLSLRSDHTPHGLQFSFPGFPYLGLWAAPGADFLCIEPWCGIADSVDADGLLEHKEGIITLPPEDAFVAQWSVRFF